MKGTPIFVGKIITLSLTAVVALLTAACFTIILEEQPPEDEARTVEPVRGEFDPRSDPQSSDQTANSFDAPELVFATAVFVPTVTPSPTLTIAPKSLPTYRLSVNGVPAIDSMLALDGGTVEVSSPPQEPEGLYFGGDQIHLTAIPAEGYQFDGWEGDCSSDGNVCVLAINGNKELSVGFVPLDRFFRLDLVADPDGGGEVQVLPLPNAPDGRYADGTQVELRAIDAEGFKFTGWDGECVGDDNKCWIVMNGDKSVTAGFMPGFYTLTINQLLIDGSSVPVDHGVIGVSPVADAENKGYAGGGIVSLTSNPDAGYVLTDWGGDCAEQELNAIKCTLSMDGDKLLEVTFALEAPIAQAAADTR